MPFLSATLCAEPSAGLTSRVVLALTDLTVKLLGKERERTTVVVHYVPDTQWAVGGVSGYVALDEIAPDSWGHGGETQEVRYARGMLA
jgi:phenylpyruvate tautomerase PptA (4-oxalocrotonate tautomerase family)